MAEFSVQNIPSQKALAPLVFAATDGSNADQFKNDGNTLLILDNTDAGAQSVTVDGQPDPKFGCDISETINMAAGERAIMGPLAPTGWNAGNSVFFTSTAAAVEAAVARYSPRT